MKCSVLWLSDTDFEEKGHKMTRSVRYVDMEKCERNSWTEKESSEKVLKRVGEKRQLLQTIRRRQQN